MLKRTIAILLCALIVASFAGCSKKKKSDDEEVKTTTVVTEIGEMELTPGKPTEEIVKYFEGFEETLHGFNVDKLSKYIVKDTGQKGVYLGYMADETYHELFKFYAQETHFEPLEVLGDGWVAVKVSYLDNRYNDYQRPVLAGEGDPRGDFYKSVNESIETLRQQLVDMGIDPDAPIQIHQVRAPDLVKIEQEARTQFRKQLRLDVEKDVASGDISTVLESELDRGMAEDVNAEVLEVLSNIPKAARHEGWNYVKEQAIDDWVKFLKSKKDSLQRIEDIVYFKMQTNGDQFGLVMTDDELVTLCGRLPIFVGLDTKYIINDYDLYYKYTQFLKQYDRILTESYAGWDELLAMDDASARQVVLNTLHDELVEYSYQLLDQENARVSGTPEYSKASDEDRVELLVKERMQIEANLDRVLELYPVFGQFSVSTDLEKIKRNFMPRDVGALVEMSLAQINIRAYYMLLHDDPSLKEFMQTWKASLEPELIKQDGKNFYVRYKTPDLNGIIAPLLNEKTWNPIELRKEVVAKIQAGEGLPYTYEYCNVDIQPGLGQFGIAFGTNFDMEFIEIHLNAICQQALGLQGLKKIGLDDEFKVTYAGLPEGVYGSEGE